MPRRPFTILSATSLVLCVATCLLWAQSRTAAAGVRGPVINGWKLSVWQGDLVIDSSPRLELMRAGRQREIESLLAEIDMTGAPLAEVVKAAERWREAGEPSGGAAWHEFQVAKAAYARHGDQLRRFNDLFSDGCGRPVSHRVPLLALAAATAAAPSLSAAMGVRQVRRRRSRSARNRCPACGYDLRATLGRCLECGAAGAR